MGHRGSLWVRLLTPTGCLLILRRPGAAEHQGAETIYELGRQTIVPDQESHVDRAVKRIEQKIRIDVLAEFAARNAPTKCGISFATPRHEEAFPEGCDEGRIGLTRREDGGDDAAPGTAEYLYELPHLAAHIGVQGTGVWKVKMPGGAVGKG